MTGLCVVETSEDILSPSITRPWVVSEAGQAT